MNDIIGNKKYIKGKRILVVGMGRSGTASITVLRELGAIVSAYDGKTADELDPKIVTNLQNNGIEAFFGIEPKGKEYDMLILSPGVPTDLDFIKEARAKGSEVIGELELGYRLSKGKYVAITGTNGKTTTTMLTGSIFENSGRKTEVVGNIGVAVVSKAIESSEDEWLITEASSFQLESIDTFKPVVSAILNLAPDHLNRHKTMGAYANAKASVFKNQTKENYLIINKDDEDCFKLAKNSKAKVIPFSRTEKLDLGAYLEDDMMVIRDENGIVHKLCKVNEMNIIGGHNVENALASAAISFFSGIKPQVIADSIKAFPGVEHRIEYCGEVDGVKYYNDSKGTNVDAAETALKALDDNIILIAGGDGKAQDFTELAQNFSKHLKALVLLGRDADQIAECAKKVGFTNCVFKKDMNECVTEAASIASEGDKVLLSPACASWDMYDNYEQRGEHFKACVDQMMKK